MKRQIYSSVICLIYVFFLGCDSAKDNSFRIGITGPQVGIYADIGQGMMDGATLACEELSEESKVDFLPVCCDDGGDPKKTVTCLNRLMVSGVDGLIIMGDNQVPAVADFVRNIGIPTIATIVGTSKFLCGENSHKGALLRNYSNIERSAAVIATFAREKLLANTAVVFYSKNAYGEDGRSAFVGTALKNGLKIMCEVAFEETSTSQKDVIVRGVCQDPDVVYVVGFGNGYNVLLNQLREFGYNRPILTDEPVSGPSCKGFIKKFDNIYFTNNSIPDSEAYKKFLTSYRNRFRREPNVFSLYGYDSMKIMGDSLLHKGTDSVKEYVLRKKRFQTLLGGVEFLSDGDCSIPITVNRFLENGNYTTVK